MWIQYKVLLAMCNTALLNKQPYMRMVRRGYVSSRYDAASPKPNSLAMDPSAITASKEDQLRTCVLLGVRAHAALHICVNKSRYWFLTCQTPFGLATTKYCEAVETQRFDISSSILDQGSKMRRCLTLDAISKFMPCVQCAGARIRPIPFEWLERTVRLIYWSTDCNRSALLSYVRSQTRYAYDMT